MVPKIRKRDAFKQRLRNMIVSTALPPHHKYTNQPHQTKFKIWRSEGVDRIIPFDSIPKHLQPLQIPTANGSKPIAWPQGITPQASPLIRLPAELRLKIWEFVYQSNEDPIAFQIEPLQPISNRQLKHRHGWMPQYAKTILLDLPTGVCRYPRRSSPLRIRQIFFFRFRIHGAGNRKQTPSLKGLHIF